MFKSTMKLTDQFLEQLAKTRPHAAKVLKDHNTKTATLLIGSNGGRSLFRVLLEFKGVPAISSPEFDRQVTTDDAAIVLDRNDCVADDEDLYDNLGNVEISNMLQRGVCADLRTIVSRLNRGSLSNRGAASTRSNLQ